MLHVIEYFAKSLKVIQNDIVEKGECEHHSRRPWVK